jgi:acyl-coenzyme A synthetase/AMP-(fatty) acid ligase/thioesterase domain-containing protein
VKSLDAADIDLGVIGRFRAVLDAAPDAPAVITQTRTVSFAALGAAAAKVRRSLSVISDVNPDGGPVALLMGHDAPAVAAVLGVIATGRPLFVLDAMTPAPRLRTFVARVGARTCVTDRDHEETARQLVGQVVRPDVLAGADPAGDGDPAPLWQDSPDPSRPAVLMFTSGSTGVPKVVVVDQRQLVSDAWLNSTAGGCYDATDVVAHTLPMGFAAGLLLTTALPMVGATAALYDVRTAGVGGLAAWVHRAGATVLHASPAILRRFTETEPDPAHLAGLRVLTVAGEPVHGRDVERARGVLPSSCTVYNRYGSSETGLVADFRLQGDDPPVAGPLPAGFAVGNTRITLVGSDGRPVPQGESGIVAVTRPNLALGYHDDRATTESAFTDNDDGTRTYLTSDVGMLDEKGRLRLLGRRDHSVKIRGYLVEPGEVDAALFALPEVKEAVVVGTPRPDDGVMRLVAYVVPAVEQFSAAAVRAALRETLPPHMVPETVVFTGALPRTERGKLDRSALPEPPAPGRGSDGQEFSQWEQLVGDAWARALSLDDVGLDDDFFELGGDSLAAETLMSIMVRELHAQQASTSVLVQAPTLREFARSVGRRAQPAGETLVPLKPSGSRPPLFIVAGGGGLGVAFMQLARRLDDDQPVWAFQARAMEKRGIPDWSVRALAKRNLATLLRLQPHGSYHLAGHSFGGLVALEMAHRLRRDGREVALLIELDAFPPDPGIHERTPGPLKERLREAAAVALTGIKGEPGVDHSWRFQRQSEVMHRRYRCEPWPGETLVVIADTAEREQRGRWGPHLSGPWRTVDVEGDHLSMLREPYVGSTAAVVQEALDRVHGIQRA